MKEDKIVRFLFEISTLRRLTRSHRQMIQEVSDNVSDHSFRVAVIGMILAELEKADTNRVLKICLFHDLAEARTGDANAVNKQYLDLHEDEAIEDQLEGLPIRDEIWKLLQEYKERKSKESIIAKDADSLDQMILNQQHFYKDKINNNAWQTYALKNIKTKSAKKLAARIKKSNPLEWLYDLLESKTGAKLLK